VLQVRIHHRDERRGGGQDALDTGARQPMTPEALDHAHAPVIARDDTYLIGGTVRGVIVDEYHLPGAACERCVESRHQRRDVVALLEGRHNNGQLDAWLGHRSALSVP
jgi:hypothetical protein